MSDRYWLVYRRSPGVCGPIDDLIGAVKAPHWDAAVLFAQRFETSEFEFLRLLECTNAGQRNHAEWFLATEANAIDELEWQWNLQCDSTEDCKGA